MGADRRHRRRLPHRRRSGRGIGRAYSTRAGRDTASARGAAGPHCDALVYSAVDAFESSLATAGGFTAELRVATEGVAGGSWERADGTSGRYAAAPLPGPAIDSYGAGDLFVAGLTLGLGRGLGVPAALALAARCGAWCMTGRGPYGRTPPLP